MDSFTTPRRWTFPVYAVLLFSVSCFIHAIVESSRFQGDTRFAFAVGKIVFGILGFGLMYPLYRYPERDLYKGLVFCLLNIYTIYFMWMAPLYEVSYLQCAIACAFMRTNSRRLFAAMFGMGLAGIYLTYYLRDRWNISVVPSSRVDWLFTTVVFFIIAWLIQRFAVRTFRREEDRLARLSLIGAEATRLLQEVDALLQRPLALSKAMTGAETTDITGQIQTELKVAQQTLRKFRVETSSIQSEPSDVRQICANAAERLRVRLGMIGLPEARVYLVDPSLLESVFFNLMLNSVESCERRRAPAPCVTLRWSGDVLIYADAGKIEERGRDEERGLGLPIIRADLGRMKVGFEEREEGDGLKFAIDFSRAKPARSDRVL